MKMHRIRKVGMVLLAIAVLSGCVGLRGLSQSGASDRAPIDSKVAVSMLEYLRQLQDMSPQELRRQRNVLNVIDRTPTTRLQLAMLLGESTAPADLAQARNLLEEVLASEDAGAAGLHPLARLLLNLTQERQRLETMSEKLTTQLKDSQRKVDVLQEKFNAIADIEHSIPVRPASGKIVPRSAK